MLTLQLGMRCANSPTADALACGRQVSIQERGGQLGCRTSQVLDIGNGGSGDRSILALAFCQALGRVAVLGPVALHTLAPQPKTGCVGEAGVRHEHLCPSMVDD
jgi:hypothetical protein